MEQDSTKNGGFQEPLSLSMEALSALQSVVGQEGDDPNNLLVQLLQRRDLEDSSEDDNEDEDDENPSENDRNNGLGESHIEYYKRLHPERFKNAEKNCSNGSASINLIENPVALITMEDEYVQNLIVAFFAKKTKWRIVTCAPPVRDHCKTGNGGKDVMVESCNEKFHLHWGEYEHIDWFSEEFVSGEMVVSCYFNRKGLIRKANLAKILENWQTKHQKLKAPFAPKSYVLRLPLTDDSVIEPMDSNFATAFEQSVQLSGFPGFPNDGSEKSQVCRESSTVHGEVYILKPSFTNQAKGISLVRSYTQLRDAMYQSDQLQKAGDFVLQQYIQPLLLDGRKFHLRVFMLLHGNLTAYVHPDFLAIFSLEKYSNASLDNTQAHLTNIAHQNVLSSNDEHRCMRRFEETKLDMIDANLVTSESKANEKIEAVRGRVYEIVAEMMEAVSCELTFVSKSNCFEIFGIDFMIDPNFRVWLLEVNAEPDLSKAGERLQHVIDNMLEETLDIVIGTERRQKAHHSFVKVFDKRGRSF